MIKTFDNNFKRGCLAGFGIPGISLAASFFALGALFKNTGLNVTQIIWIILAETSPKPVHKLLLNQ